MEHPENSSEYAGLQVNSGVEQPAIINPYMKRNRFRRRELSAAEMVEGIVKGDVTILSQAVTLVESVNPDHQAKAQEVINKCLPYSGNSIRVGISGVPGAGKSTSIDAFGIHVLNEKGGKLAVLAIDPSSERSKGSILGDKTRMEKLSVHPDSFIRPSPTAGSLGGVARKTRETIILCEAAGFDKIFVETVGVGQSETACHSMVDFFLLIQLAGTGDELQGIKRGIMEISDGIVINKCDGENVDKCQMAATNFRNALHFFPMPESGWLPKVLCYSGFFGLGIKEVWDMIYQYIDFVKQNGYFNYRRNEQAKYWMYETINEQLRLSFYNDALIQQRLQQADQKAEEELGKGETLYCLGDIVHNGMECERLRNMGLVTIDHDQMRQLHHVKVLLRAHGEPPETYELARSNNIEIIDATCPVVLQLQKRIKKQFEAGDGQIVIFGKKGHAEVLGLVGQTQSKAIVIENFDEVTKLDFTRDIYLYSQTTKSLDEFHRIIEYIQGHMAAGATFKSFDTICRSVANRMPNISQFATRHDLILFVCGRKSSNGKVLFNECKRVNPNTHLIEGPEEIDPTWLDGIQTVGICGATSTPKWLMEQCRDAIQDK